MQRTLASHAAVMAAVAVAVAIPVSSAFGSGGTLNGAGSSLVAPLVQTVFGPDFKKSTGNMVNYSSVGSSAGIAAATGRTVDFGASDAPLTSSQQSACNCVEIAWALTATGVSWNVPGIHHLNITGPVLAKIYLGQITNWDNKAITSLNKGEHFPNLAITPIHRLDGSGDSYAFTDYLSSVSPQWAHQIGRATSPAFPTGPGGQGNGGMVTVLGQTKGGIAYIAVSYLIAHRLPAAALKNQAGHYEVPNLRNIANAASVGHEASSGEIHIVNAPKRAKIAYPISTFTYCILQPTDPQGNGAELKSFVDYALNQGQSFGPALDFVPLPKNIKRSDLAKANQIR